jgi:iron complex transport system substrate-binding protein
LWCLGFAAGQEEAKSLAVLEETSEYRVIRHARGETRVLAEPKCVVVAGSGYLDHLLALGVTPCGAAHGGGGSGFPDYLAEHLGDVAYVGGVLEVNLETVLALEPDLIIGMHPAHTIGDFATNFDAVGSTVYLQEPWRDWRQALLELGTVLGKRDVAEVRLAEFDRRLSEARAALERNAGDSKVMFLRVLPKEIRPYGTASPIGQLLFDGLGLTPAAMTPIGEHAQAISNELIAEFDAEHIFLLDQTDDAMATIKASSLWQNVPAVKQGNLYPVDVKLWIQGEGLLAYERIVQEVLEHLTGSR